MSDIEMFKAVQQYERFGKITACEDCQRFNNQNCVKGYGICSILGRMMKENEFCCYGKERESEDSK